MGVRLGRRQYGHHDLDYNLGHSTSFQYACLGREKPCQKYFEFYIATLMPLLLL